MELQDLKGNKSAKFIEVRMTRATRFPVRDAQEGYQGVVDVAQPGEIRKLDALSATEAVTNNRAVIVGSNAERVYLSENPPARAKA